MKPFYNNFDKNKFRFFIIFIILLILILFLIIVFLKIREVYYTYQNAETYKKYYEVIESEINYCNSIQNTSQPRDNFVYCDRLLNKFHNLKEQK